MMSIARTVVRGLAYLSLVAILSAAFVPPAFLAAQFNSIGTYAGTTTIGGCTILKGSPDEVVFGST